MSCRRPRGVPLSRFSRAELRRHVLAAGIVAAKAGPVLDLYHRRWKGQALGPRDFVLSADEKTQIQLITPRHPITPPLPRHPMRVSADYRRHGTCAYVAAWDVHCARLFGRVVSKISIDAFDALVADVMTRAPHCTAGRVFWIVDNGTIHRGRRTVARLQARWPTFILVHLPVHASWLNQVEIYFSISSAKRSRRPTLPPRALLPTAFSGSNDTTKRSHDHLSGALRAPTFAVS